MNKGLFYLIVLAFVVVIVDITSFHSFIRGLL